MEPAKPRQPKVITSESGPDTEHTSAHSGDALEYACRDIPVYQQNLVRRYKEGEAVEEMARADNVPFSVMFHRLGQALNRATDSMHAESISFPDGPETGEVFLSHLNQLEQAETNN